MRQYPIYNIIYGQGKQSSANFGSHDGFTQRIQVGSSAQNSHTLGVLDVRTWTDNVGRVHFELTVDDVRIKHGVYEPHDRRVQQKRTRAVDEDSTATHFPGDCAYAGGCHHRTRYGDCMGYRCQ